MTLKLHKTNKRCGSVIFNNMTSKVKFLQIWLKYKVYWFYVERLKQEKNHQNYLFIEFDWFSLLLTF